MNIRIIDETFAVTGQLTPADIAAIKEMGYRGVVCARPDDEEAGQPAFADIAAVVVAEGLKAVHIPVSGPLTEGQIIRFREAMAGMDGPVLGYCRSGARAGNLYAAIKR